MTQREKPPLPTLDAFPARTFDTIRYGDTDKAGHVNNAVFSTYLETGRTQILVQQDGMMPKGTFFSLVHLVLDYRAEVTWPGRVEIGSRIKAIGRTSVTMEQAIFQGETCVATAETVVVMVDSTTRRPTPLPEDTIARFRPLCA